MSRVLRSAAREGPGWEPARAPRSRRAGWGKRTRWRQTGQVVAPLSHCYSGVSWSVYDKLGAMVSPANSPCAANAGTQTVS